MKRRTFLKTAGLSSLSLAAGCGPNPEKHLYTLVAAPDDMVTGAAAWYASTCRECPAGCGIIAKNREGRVVKVEGNPLHPINQGGLCMRGQAAVQALYHPDRIKTPLLRDKDQWRPLPWRQAMALLREKCRLAARKGPGQVGLLSEVVGDSMEHLMRSIMRKWNSPQIAFFEPFAYESLRAANRAVLGVDGLPSYRMETADLIVGFGADFLETWLSPVEYARKFKAMHGIDAHGKGFFVHIGPFRSLTGTNADFWLACRPGTEAVVALGLVHQLLAADRGQQLPAAMQAQLQQASSAFDTATVARLAEIPADDFNALTEKIVAAKAPLILPTGMAAAGPGALPADIAIQMLNRMLDPQLARLDFQRRHRVEMASARGDIHQFFDSLQSDAVPLLLLNQVNPVFDINHPIQPILADKDRFVVSFASFMDETCRLADLVFPVRMPLESWDDYRGRSDALSLLQPAAGKLTEAPLLGDVLLEVAHESEPRPGAYRDHLLGRLHQSGAIADTRQQVQALRRGGVYAPKSPDSAPLLMPQQLDDVAFKALRAKVKPPPAPVLIAAPSIRFFDGRGANRAWLSEIPDALTQVAWQTPLQIHARQLSFLKVSSGEMLRLQAAETALEAPAYPSDLVREDTLVLAIGQGRRAYARNHGSNPLTLLPATVSDASGGPQYSVGKVSVTATGSRIMLANMDGSRSQHGRKIALTVAADQLAELAAPGPTGLTMHTFPLTLPLPEGYDEKRDIYPPHEHRDNYRWGMVVDLDRCIGCGACTAACYAENNIGVVGERHILEGREMSWLRIERYHNPQDPTQVTFLPMMCQHCDNAPCESVCPVYAPHHSPEGLNNQIYNRCIGTRFCSQNCPYKVRRFNWYDWPQPAPTHLQYNPDVTVRGKGVMEKCSFCVQRIKAAHNVAKNESRRIRDGEVLPACAQTCPTGALTFGNMAEPESRVYQMTADPRAYQVMGYLNTKPAVIYLRKVLQEI